MISKIFCNVPWREVHINADGTYHVCGAQPNKIYGTPAASIYNVFNMTIQEWMASEYQHIVRNDKLDGIADVLCNMCYHEDDLGSSSKRVKENLKDGISTIDFYNTFDKSKFENVIPRINSVHISLGNECNLACKMCTPMASSKIAAQDIRLGTFIGKARMNWTDDQQAWEHVTKYISELEDLQFVHLIGGEPLLNPRFEEMIDILMLAGKTDIYLGFTTNGTVFNESLMQKMKAFRHVDVGVSIECAGDLNELIRPGIKTQTVLDNTELYLKHRRQGHIYVTLRAVPSALSVHTLDDLFKWCIDRELDVVTNMLVRPAYQQIKQLPQDVKQRLLEQYNKWEFGELAPHNSNPRDPTWFRSHIDSEIKAIIKALEQPNDPVLTQELYNKLESWQWFNNSQITNYFNTVTKT
jgi:MoaA/NifB/PqqE/SkfB family radical SAM enzyme